MRKAWEHRVPLEIPTDVLWRRFPTLSNHWRHKDLGSTDVWEHRLSISAILETLNFCSQESASVRKWGIAQRSVPSPTCSHVPAEKEEG